MPLTRTRRVFIELRDLKSELKDLKVEMRDLKAEAKLEMARNREMSGRVLDAVDRFDRNMERDFALNREQHEKGRQTYERLEAFTEELSKRNERVMREITSEMSRELRDLRDQSRAQLEGFLALIDRFFPEPPPRPNEG